MALPFSTVSTALNNCKTESALNPQPQDWIYPLSDQEKPIHKKELHSVSLATSLSDNLYVVPLGRPTTKKRLHITDILLVTLSFICLAAAITVVADEEISWSLGVETYQLIILGFLLSIMNLCLCNVTPNLFIHLEARFGLSTLQNYDGILRNQIFSSRLSIAWRLVLSLMLALPLGLSAAYKDFLGGESVKIVNATDYTGNTSFYGMFAPPGLQSLGQKTGISLFSNATLPFMVASSSTASTEPPVPTREQAYGFNILLLNTESTAMLDIPQPDYVSSVQNLLAPGES